MLIANLVRGSKYSLVSLLSFGLEELILGLGLYLFGISSLVPSNVAAVFLSVAFAFFANEYWTVSKQGDHSGFRKGLLARLLKFELVYAAGSAIGVIVQVLIWHYFGINPVIANVGGAAVAYPVNYLISLLYVWRIRAWRE